MLHGRGSGLTDDIFQDLFDVADSQIISVCTIVDVFLQFRIIIEFDDLQSRILLVFTVTDTGALSNVKLVGSGYWVVGPSIKASLHIFTHHQTSSMIIIPSPSFNAQIAVKTDYHSDDLPGTQVHIGRRFAVGNRRFTFFHRIFSRQIGAVWKVRWLTTVAIAISRRRRRRHRGDGVVSTSFSRIFDDVQTRSDEPVGR